MKSAILAIASLFAGAAVAQPHRHQQHHHQKRQDPQDVVWVTDYDYVTETVDMTTTVWVSSGFVPPATDAAPTPSASPSDIAGQFFQPAQSHSAASSVNVAPTPSTLSSAYVAPAPSSTSVAPPASSSAVVAPPASVAAPPASSPAPVDTPAPTTSAAPAPAAPTTAQAPPPAASSPSSGSSGGQCSSGSPCTGDMTFYQAGMGACGSVTDGDAEQVVALPFELMGEQSNGNPYCGKTITVRCKVTGKTTTATVVDKCMGCKDFAIDLSNAAFLKLDTLNVGRTTADWWFN